MYFPFVIIYIKPCHVLASTQPTQFSTLSVKVDTDCALPVESPLCVHAEWETHFYAIVILEDT